jgi:hypothetical protein
VINVRAPAPGRCAFFWVFDQEKRGVLVVQERAASLHAAA